MRKFEKSWNIYHKKGESMTKALLILAILNNDLQENIKEYQKGERLKIEQDDKEVLKNG